LVAPSGFPTKPAPRAKRYFSFGVALANSFDTEIKGGVTFGAPGDPDLTAPQPTRTLINFVDYGDPVGNYLNHFGSVVDVGLKSQEGLPA